MMILLLDIIPLSVDYTNFYLFPCRVLLLLLYVTVIFIISWLLLLLSVRWFDQEWLRITIKYNGVDKTLFKISLCRNRPQFFASVEWSKDSLLF